MQMVGPARAMPLLKTRTAPTAPPPWHAEQLRQRLHAPGAYLTCEENWAGYFASATPTCRANWRHGLRSTSRFGWDTLPGDEFQRFDATRKAADASGDYRNEPNHFGWIVEIDPSTRIPPRSSTAPSAAFAHEGLIFAPGAGRPPGLLLRRRCAERIHLQVRQPWQVPLPRQPGRPLDEGVPYVARFQRRRQRRPGPGPAGTAFPGCLRGGRWGELRRPGRSADQYPSGGRHRRCHQDGPS